MAPTSQEHNRQSLLLVFGCTVIGAVAQLLIKSGAQKLSGQPTFLSTVWAMAVNLPLMTGLCLYGLSAVLLVLALRQAELSTIYPIIALTFVWVTILSAVVLGESMTMYKLAGTAIIVSGVAVLGLGSRR